MKLTTISDQVSKLKNLFVLAPDDFGLAVHQRLSELFVDAKVSVFKEPLQLSEMANEGDCVVFAAEHVDTTVCRVLDEIVSREKSVFITTFINETHLRVGPLVVPGKSACWHCYHSREQQHAPQDQLAPVHAARASNLATFLIEPFAQIAASRIAYTLGVNGQLRDEAAFIWDWGLRCDHIQESSVVGIHDCPRCGLHRPIESMSTVALLTECRELWFASEGEVCKSKEMSAGITETNTIRDRSL